MEILIYVYLFIVGACFGSFYNVVGLRITEGKSIVRPGSCCPKCGHEIKGWELIPIFSYFLLGGKCRMCKTRISTKYMIFELVTALLFVYSYLMLGLSMELIVALLVVSLFVIISVSDLEYMIIEDIILVIFLVLLVMSRLFIDLPPNFTTFSLHPILESLIGGIFGFGLLYWIGFIGQIVYNKEVMGGGDIKLYGILGIVLGFKLTLLSLFLASLLGSFVGLVFIKTKVIKKDTPVPFGPFICLASLISYFYGPELISWYFNLLV
ncbi:MAG: prepilin peptidase [Haloplasmataceae bacterium]|jgi:leader peptidase (prepilin peptidase)/N-methyltransferase|nr:prepilin peptidase [Haloplasmataceae bacterium]